MELQNYVSHLCSAAWKTPNGTYSLFSVYDQNKNRKVIVFDTKVTTQDFIEHLADDRFTSWSEDGETCWYTPIEAGKANMACVVTDYDPYNRPPNSPVPSEAHGKEWKHHILNWEAFYDVGGNLKRNDDGTVTNLAIG